MTYSSPFVYLKVLGHFGTTTSQLEQWTVGMKIPTPLPGPSPAGLSAFLVDIQTYISAFHGSTFIKASTSCFVRQLSAAYVGTDGKYVGGGAQATTVYNYATPVSGNSNATLPWSTACVLSLRTARQRGIASNGRLYWPSLALAVNGATGLWTPTETLNIATSAKTMLDNINSHTETHLGGARRIAVMSAVGAGLSADVTAVRVGNKPDRQERREDSLTEAYAETGLASTLEALEDSRDRRFSDPLFA